MNDFDYEIKDAELNSDDISSLFSDGFQINIFCELVGQMVTLGDTDCFDAFWKDVHWRCDILVEYDVEFNYVYAYVDVMEFA